MMASPPLQGRYGPMLIMALFALVPYILVARCWAALPPSTGRPGWTPSVTASEPAVARVRESIGLVGPAGFRLAQPVPVVHRDKASELPGPTPPHPSALLGVFRCRANKSAPLR